MQNIDKSVTKKDLEEKIDEFAQMTNASFEKVATKEDLKQFVTKKELKKELAKLATKEDLKKFATKKDLEEMGKKFATKKDLEEMGKKFATKQDIQDSNNELFDRLDSNTYGRLNNHEVRITKIEMRSER